MMDSAECRFLYGCPATKRKRSIKHAIILEFSEWKNNFPMDQKYKIYRCGQEGY